ncbi:nuclease [Colwellia sp. 75C3]|uniref:HNH/ENDO VII family nuclease n=1 Tax=Colwellia sp. 75C3 TaxID=888425 RepID=UPI000C34DBC9|nr:HNH/ENDO VII family nuclease [Colwellia sp. 75C3]PKG85450.1 nuclease [Colwellia sp. 75C3]
MILAMEKVITDVVKEKVSEVGNKLGDKVPDFSKNNETSSLESKIPTFKRSAKEINNNPVLQESEQNEIKNKSEYSKSINEAMYSTDELSIYQDVPLAENTVNDNLALCRDDIDLNKADEMGQSNLERMEKGKPPVDQTGKPIELHHVGQKADSPLAELSYKEHRDGEVGNNIVLHDGTQDSKINRVDFDKEKRDYWKERVEQLKVERV